MFNESRITIGGITREFAPSDEKEKPEELKAENEKSEKDELKEKTKKEQQEAKENFKDLIGMVSRGYESLPEKMREDFVIHNEEILYNAIELGVRKNLSPEELKTLEISAILHDSAKADAAPEEYKDIPNYALAAHGEKAANEAEKILTDEYLSAQGFSGNLENVRKNISAAIREHMGPHPGFMDGILDEINEKLREKGEKEIEHPEAQGKISETLLVADMASLAGEKGRKKVLSIRENVAVFKNIDLQTVAEYKKYGIVLKQGEAALLSGFESAFQARNMIENEEDGKWIEKAIKESIAGDYSFAGEKINTAEAFKKLRLFNEARRDENKLKSVRKQLAT